MNDVERKKRKSDHAKRILDDQIIKEAIEELRKTCFYNIETSSHDQSEQREDLYYMLRCISAFERQLKQFISEGTVSVHNENIKRIAR